MKYWWTEVPVFIWEFCLKTAKHRVTDGTSVELPPGTYYLEYENKSS